jgi:hypothetical protein
VSPFSVGNAQQKSFAARFRAAAVDEACLTWPPPITGAILPPPCRGAAAALLTSTPQGPPGPHRAARLSLPSRSQAIVRAGRSRFGALQKPRKAPEASEASAVTRGRLLPQQSEPSTPHNSPHQLAAVPVCSPVCSTAPWLCAHPKRLAAATHHAPIWPISSPQSATTIGTAGILDPNPRTCCLELLSHPIPPAQGLPRTAVFPPTANFGPLSRS